MDELQQVNHSACHASLLIIGRDQVKTNQGTEFRKKYQGTVNLSSKKIKIK